MTPADLQLCIDLGLAEEIRDGVYVLTHAGRVLAGIPPARRAEAFAAWWARVSNATDCPTCGFPLQRLIGADGVGHICPVCAGDES